MAKGGGIKAGNTGSGDTEMGWVSGGSATRAAEQALAKAQADYNSGAVGIGAVRSASQALEAAHYNSAASVQSRALAAAINEHGAKLPGGVQVSARSQVSDGANGKIHTVEVTGKKLGTNHVSTRTLSGPTDHSAVISGIEKDIASKVKESKAKSKFRPER